LLFTQGNLEIGGAVIMNFWLKISKYI
jgi:hypothetical protein